MDWGRRRHKPSTSSTQIPQPLELARGGGWLAAIGAGEERDEVQEGGTKPVLVLRGFVLRKEGGEVFDEMSKRG